MGKLEDTSIKQLATTITVLLSLGAGLGYLGSLVASQWELERGLGAAIQQSLAGDIRANDLRSCEMQSWSKETKEAAIFAAFECLRDRHRKELLRLNKKAEELTR